MIICIALLTVACLMPCAGAEPVLEESRAGGVFRPFPEQHGGASLKYFFSQDSYLETYRYVTEATFWFQHALFSIRESALLLVDVKLDTNMGRSVAAYLPFSPIETGYKIVPFGEYRRGTRLYRLGWDHGCRHLTFKDDEIPWYEEYAAEVEPIIFYNRVFLGAGSRSFRRADLRRRYLGKRAARRPAGEPTLYIDAGIYVRSLGRGIRAEALSTGNDWAWDLGARSAYPLFIRDSFAVLLNNDLRMLASTTGRNYWRYRVEVETMLGKSGFGTSLFAAANPLDEHPDDGRQGLVEFGIRSFF